MAKWSKILLAVQLVILILIAILYTDLANAHARFALDGSTPPRSESSGIKTGPCGNDPRSTNPTLFEPGQQITVQWEETINHPGYFRIAFSLADDQGFDQNVLYQVQDDQNDQILPHFYNATLNLPDKPCQYCTLQLIQYMTETDPPGQYFSCADIQLASKTPPAPVQNIMSATGNNEVSLAWQYPTSEPLGVIIIQSDTSLSQLPADGVSYQVGDVVGNGTVVFNGNGSQYVATQLVPQQTYQYTLFTYSLWKIYSQGITVQETVPETTARQAIPNAVSQLQVTAVDISANLSWVNPLDNFYKVLLVWDTAPIVVDPVDGQRYNVGDQIGTAHVVFNGLGNQATVTNLSINQRHYFKVYAHNASFDYAAGQATDTFISNAAGNIIPSLSIALSQNGSPVTRIYQDKGIVVAKLLVQDDNNINQGTVNWTGTDARLIDMDQSQFSLTFNPAILAQGSYTLHVSFVDSGNPPQTAVLTTKIAVSNANSEDTSGAGSISHLMLLLFLLILQRYYVKRTR